MFKNNSVPNNNKRSPAPFKINFGYQKSSQGIKINKKNAPFHSSWNFSRGSSVYDLQKANWDVTKKNKPSDKITKMKFSDPFSFGSKHQTNFGYVYSAGGIPCRIEHGNVKMKLKWEDRKTHV